MATTFPRVIKPYSVAPFSKPSPLLSHGHSGKGQARNTVQRGRQWEEQWINIDADSDDGSEFLALLEKYWSTGELLDVDYRPKLVPRGLIGGTPLVNGASQTGASLICDGASISVTGWLKAGDIIRVVGINHIFDVTADCNSDGSGNVTIPITPTIITGNSPADNAAVTVTGVVIQSRIVAQPVYTNIPPHLHVPNLRVIFREQP